MPELPEVENVRRGLSELLKDQPLIKEIEFRRPDLRDPIPTKQLLKLRGWAVHSIQRRSKYLFFATAAGGLLSHLGMTGTWRPRQQQEKLGLHDHVRISFSSGLEIIYRDPRRFGILDWAEALTSPHPRLDHLGPEPLSDAFSADYLWEETRHRDTPIKNILMNAEVVVGIGNIYASESLFRSGVRPGRSAHRVKRSEVELIVKQAKEVLEEAILSGGSSISDYVGALGEKGDFQSRFRVYDREGERCFSCTSVIRREVHAGRSSFFCVKCQK